MDDNSKLEKWYNNYKSNKNKLKIKDWVVVDEEYYNQYKNNITINNIKLYSGENEHTKRKEKYILAESKDKYIIIKYNSNFIAVNICEREYDLMNNIILVMVNDKSVYNIENNVGEPPEIKEIIKVLGWKATRKAMKDLEEFE
ncbi:MAG: hypothetical protein EBR82_47565 [Caulobacteraceae bacterium]|nr:hypothetical protein [Caulobacteraceae bacterium]